jgi:hypothetical protein
MGQKQMPSAKVRKVVLRLLEREHVVTTSGNLGRLCGKIAQQTNTSSAAVSGVLESEPMIEVGEDGEGRWYAKLARAS